MTNRGDNKNNYTKAPIIEALVDIVVQPAKSTDYSVFKLFKTTLESDYPAFEKIIINNIQPAEMPITNKQEEIGIKLTSQDKKYTVQFKKTGFTFSVLNHYPGWEEFIEKAKNLWSLYYSNIQPEKVTRVALRYINRIDIPSTNFKLEDYFETYPTVLQKTQANLSAFFLQAQLPQKEGGMAVINQAITEPSQIGYTSIMLDIDVFDMAIFNPNESKFWSRIETLRDQKNFLFENSITQKTKELIK